MSARRKGRAAGSRELAREAAKENTAMTAARIMRHRFPVAKLKEIIKAAAECPNALSIWKSAGVSRDLLRYWLKLSERGATGDGFDVPVEGDRTERFHILFASAWADGADVIMQEAWDLARGTAKEQLQFQGHITYRIDPVIAKAATELDDLDWTLQYGERSRLDIFIRDENGNYVPEFVGQRDPEMVRFLLKHLRKETFGNVMKVEHEHKGGVLVVGAQMSPKQLESHFGGESKIVDVQFEDIPEDKDVSGSD